MPPSLTLVVLAAGAGSRYGGLKQLVPVGPSGETLLEYSIYDALKGGFTRIVLVIRKEHRSIFSERLDDRLANRVQLTYAHQSPVAPPGEARSRRTKPWGTGHAVLTAASVVNGAFASVNADDYYGAHAFSELAQFLERTRSPGPPFALAMVGYPISKTLTDSGPVSRALCHLDPNDQLASIEELTKVWSEEESVYFKGPTAEPGRLDPNSIVSMNLWGFPRGFFERLSREFEAFLGAVPDPLESEFLLPDVVGEMIRTHQAEVEVLKADTQWCGLTFATDREATTAHIAALVEEGHYPIDLWA